MLVTGILETRHNVIRDLRTDLFEMQMLKTAK